MAASIFGLASLRGSRPNWIQVSDRWAWQIALHGIGLPGYFHLTWELGTCAASNPGLHSEPKSDSTLTLHGHQQQGSTHGACVGLLQFRFCDNLRSISGNGFHRQLSSKHSQPLSHAGESDPRLGSGGFKAHAKVPYLQDDRVVGTTQFDDSCGSTTVLDYIIQCFLRDAVHTERQVGWHVLRHVRNMERYWDMLLRRDFVAKFP